MGQVGAVRDGTGPEIGPTRAGVEDGRLQGAARCPLLELPRTALDALTYTHRYRSWDL